MTFPALIGMRVIFLAIDTDSRAALITPARPQRLRADQDNYWANPSFPPLELKTVPGHAQAYAYLFPNL
jgi:hypothetical protein